MRFACLREENSREGFERPYFNGLTSHTRQRDLTHTAAMRYADKAVGGMSLRWHCA